MALAWLWLQIVYAQVNAETLAPPGDGAGSSLGWRSSLGVAAGNAQLFDFGNDVAVQSSRGFPDPPKDGRYWFRDRFIVSGHQLDRFVSRELVLRERFVHVRSIRMLVPRAGFEAYVQGGNDAALLLDARLVIGGGGRFVFVRTDHLHLWGGIGPMLEAEWRDVPAAGPDPVRMVNPRANGYFTVQWQVVPDRLVLSNTVYGQPRVDDPADVQVLEEGRLDVKVSSALTLGSTLRLRIDTRPPAALEPYDLRLANAATLSLTFAPKKK